MLYLLLIYHVGTSGVWGLKKNFALLELLERLQDSQERETVAVLLTADALQKERQVFVFLKRVYKH